MNLHFQGDGIERLLVKGKKEELDEVDGDSYKYFLLAGMCLIKLLKLNLLQILSNLQSLIYYKINVSRNLPPLPWRHVLQCWPSAAEVTDEISRDQDVLGQTPPAARPGQPGGLAGPPVQGAGRPGHGLCRDHLPASQETSAATTINGNIAN